jgi:hypothetical protein
MPLSCQLKKINNNKLNSLQKYASAQNYRILHRVVQRLSQHNLNICSPSPYSKALSKNPLIQNELVGMSVIFHCAELSLSKWNG